MHVTKDHLRHAQRLWDFHRLQMDVKPSDMILAMGSHDERVAEYSAQLLLKGLAPLLVVSGGFGKVTRGRWNMTEGERFSEIAQNLGVPPSQILVEDRASNTGENVVNTRALLQERGINISSGIIVTKPYMCRRAYATAAQQWPEIAWTVAAPALTLETYPTADVPLPRMISLMVGDLQRLRVYAEQGFQVRQAIPPEVWESYEALKDEGFDEFVIQNA